jgi:hypothetical protein
MGNGGKREEQFSGRWLGPTDGVRTGASHENGGDRGFASTRAALVRPGMEAQERELGCVLVLGLGCDGDGPEGKLGSGTCYWALARIYVYTRLMESLHGRAAAVHKPQLESVCLCMLLFLRAADTKDSCLLT